MLSECLSCRILPLTFLRWNRGLLGGRLCACGWVMLFCCELWSRRLGRWRDEWCAGGGALGSGLRLGWMGICGWCCINDCRAIALAGGGGAACGEAEFGG